MCPSKGAVDDEAPSSPQWAAELDVSIPPSELEAALRQRYAWVPGTVIDVYSASMVRWFAGLVAQINRDQSLMVRFVDPNGALLAKNLARTDLQLAAFGSHFAEMPSGFREVPSKSRPNSVVYMDATSGMKFNNLELAWRHHIQRLIDPSVDPAKYAERPGTMGLVSPCVGPVGCYGARPT
mmetsp:Transcript_85199/g.224687  ORF Transcript_85199/g.224687 Transcript_85199/m.224687 type:complete len:181 (-) Transcript_85199:207-749(-)